MGLPYGKLIYEDKKYKLTYDLKSLLSIGLVLGINYEVILMFFGFTFFKKR